MRKGFHGNEELNRHRHTIHEKSNMFPCTQCDYTTLQKSNLNRHIKRNANRPFNPNSNDHLLEQLENEEIRSMLDQNTQCGFGVTQITSTDAILPDKVCQFFRDEQPWSTDRNLRQVYVQNFHHIRDTETLNHRSRIFLRHLNQSNSPLIETIAHAIENIFLRQTNAFKINMSFSFISQHRETGEFWYHYASNNEQLLKSPRLIRNQQDLESYSKPTRFRKPSRLSSLSRFPISP